MRPFHRQGAEVRWGYPALLIVLLIAFAIQPWASHSVLGANLMQLFYPAVLVISLIPVSSSRRVVVFGVAVLLPGLWLIMTTSAGAGLVVGNVLGVAFLLVVITAILRDVLWHERVTLHSVAGALSVFLLIGITWTLAYGALVAVVPEAFAGLADDPQLRGAQLFYFSFVTLTTLGYGDITPTTPEAMSLSTIQAIVGQLYLAVLVASLVARQVSAPTQASGPESGGSDP